MKRVKELALREFGDHGAETLERYFAQIEYTAYWCIRMLYQEEGIKFVIPEGVEDVVIARIGVFELHQVKTRDEGQDPWTTAEVLPILCQQYNRRRAFKNNCCYHFVSDQRADNKVGYRDGSCGPLYRLKQLLEIIHDGQPLSFEEQKDLDWFRATLTPRVQKNLIKNYSHELEAIEIIALLDQTYIDTDSWLLRASNNHLIELGDALYQVFPGSPALTTIQLRNIYDRLILLVLRKIITEVSLEKRKITIQDVLNCRTASYYSGEELPDLEEVPGSSLLDKKALLAGFDPTELPVFHKQKQLAEWTNRRLDILGFSEALLHLNVALLDHHYSCRDKVCRQDGIDMQPGPKILSLIKPKLPSLISNYFPNTNDIDEQYCLGILWKETDLCSIWWHGLRKSGKKKTL